MNDSCNSVSCVVCGRGQVLWNGKEFSSPGHWDKVFCLTQHNDQLRLDVRWVENRGVQSKSLTKKMPATQLPSGTADDDPDC